MSVTDDVSGSAVRIRGIEDEAEPDVAKQTANVTVVDCVVTKAAAEFQCAPAIDVGYSRGISVLQI